MLKLSTYNTTTHQHTLVLYMRTGRPTATAAGFCPDPCTNNVAEFFGLRECLRRALRNLGRLLILELSSGWCPASGAAIAHTYALSSRNATIWPRASQLCAASGYSVTSTASAIQSPTNSPATASYTHPRLALPTLVFAMISPHCNYLYSHTHTDTHVVDNRAATFW